MSIRIVFVALPPLLCDILRGAIADEPDMTLAGECADYEELGNMEGRLDPDVLVMAVGEGEKADRCQHILYDHPRTKIVALYADGKQVSLYGLRPHETSVGEISPQGLLETIRIAAGSMVG